MNAFLAESAVVDFTHPLVAARAAALARETPVATAQACFEGVRDQIGHCMDVDRQEVPVTAPDVLRMGTGFCFAKSHLLVALLRRHGIPAGFRYQRLTLDGPRPPFCLHGLVALYLEGFGWFACDPRGNKPGIDARFTPGADSLAFAVEHPGETLFPGVWAEPWPALIGALKGLSSVDDYRRAPIDLAPSPDFPPAA